MRKAALYFVLFLLVFVSHLTIPVFLSAQALGSSGIEGTVMDSSGAVIPGATVTIRNVATGASRTVTADSGGRYRIVLLQPGDYEVVGEYSGFATVKRLGVRLEVGSTATVDLELPVAAAAETITVTEAAPVTEPERTEVTDIVSARAVENLPINGRRWDNFALLTPGVSPDGTFGLVSYRGIAGLYNNNQVDGADNNQAFFSEARGRTRVVYTISQSSIREFQVGLSNFSAEFGRAAGGTINAVTKSGTNEFHGQAFYFLRDDIWNAQEPFTPFKPEERRQQFGFSFGAPIVKDRLFFFGTYDQQIRSFPYFVRPSSAAFLNVRTDTCSTSLPSSTVPVVPGCTATIAFFDSLQTFVPRKAHNNVAFGKFDWVINNNHTLIAQYNWHRWRSPNGIRTAPIQTAAGSDNGFDGVKTDFLNFRLNSVLSSSVVNEARFQFGRDFEFQRPNVTDPGTSVSGGISFGMPNFLPRPAFPNEKIFQWVDNISWIRGRHSFKFGLDIYYVRELQINLFQGGGVYSYASLADVAKDCPPGATGCVPLVETGTRANFTGRHGSFSQSFDLRELGGRVFFTTTDYNFYLQDTFRVLPNLTLNYGVRYEFTRLPPPEPTTTVDPLTGTETTAAGNPAFPETTRFNQDSNNVGPRFGFSWDPWNNHRFIVRGGYGLYYGRTSNSFISTALTDNQRVFITFGFSPGDAAAPTYPNVLPAPPVRTFAAPDVLQFSRDYVRPLIHMSELALEYGLSPNMTVSATYLWSRGQRLPITRDINFSPPTEQVTYILGGETFGPFPFFTGPRPRTDVRRLLQNESIVNTQYHAVVLKVARRVSGGLAFNAHLTIAKALDDGQQRNTFLNRFAQLLDGTNKRAEYALSDLDIRKQFVAYFTWEPPFRKIENKGLRAILNGFEWSGIVTLRDGRPIDQDVTGFTSSSRTRAMETFGPNGYGGTSRPPFQSRNGFTGPGLATVDLRTTREFRITEAKKVVFVWEAFNLFNRTNFAGVDDDLLRISNSGCRTSTGTLGNCSAGQMREVELSPLTSFGVPFSASTTLWGPREFQMAIKFIW